MPSSLSFSFYFKMCAMSFFSQATNQSFSFSTSPTQAFLSSLHFDQEKVLLCLCSFFVPPPMEVFSIQFMLTSATAIG